METCDDCGRVFRSYDLEAIRSPLKAFRLGLSETPDRLGLWFLCRDCYCKRLKANIKQNGEKV